MKASVDPWVRLRLWGFFFFMQENTKGFNGSISIRGRLIHHCSLMDDVPIWNGIPFSVVPFLTWYTVFIWLQSCLLCWFLFCSGAHTTVSFKVLWSFPEVLEDVLHPSSHQWSDMFRVQEALTTILYVVGFLYAFRLQCLVVKGQAKVNWRLPAQACCSLNEGAIDFSD